jgi:hypothetical protein
MKLSSLQGLLNKTVSLEDFVSEISAEVSEYQSLIGKGGVVPIRVTEDSDVTITRTSIKLLCSLFVSGKLTQFELAYVADGMQLAEQVEFVDSWVADSVAEFTDPEINGPFTLERASEIVSESGA